ncbi:MAG: SDR family oxidoreductase [Pseudomonadota bacterium]|nr:SDR family oxidoreductase [Pseudomonadota bacterium]
MALSKRARLCLAAGMERPAVLVTGGAKRIGAVIARRFAEAGWHVVIHYGRSRAAAQALAAELPSAECVSCDMADSDAAVAMVRDLGASLADWRVLVNSAAVFHFDSVAALDPTVFTEAMTVNAATPARMAQAFLAPPEGGGARAASGRRVIDLLDMKLANPNPDFFSYTMAKHALAATVRMLAMGAVQAGNTADRVYGLAPGAMLASHDQAPQEHEASGRMNLLHRLTDPAELAEAALFLSEGWLASGETLFVDSGQHLLSQPRDVLYLARGCQGVG